MKKLILAPFIKRAKRNYREEFTNAPAHLKRRAFRRLIFFDALEDFYEGMDIYNISDKYGFKYSTVQGSIKQAELRVETFCKREGLI